MIRADAFVNRPVYAVDLIRGIQRPKTSFIRLARRWMLQALTDGERGAMRVVYRLIQVSRGPRLSGEVIMQPKQARLR